MLTPSVLARVTLPQVPPVPPVRCCIIWKRVYGCWDFFCRASFDEAEQIVEYDRLASARGTR
jgi:hypothetical protein